MKAIVIRVTKATVGVVYIFLGGYVVYSGFTPSQISRQFFDEVGFPVQMIHPIYFVPFEIVGSVLFVDGILKIRAVFRACLKG